MLGLPFPNLKLTYTPPRANYEWKDLLYRAYTFVEFFCKCELSRVCGKIPVDYSFIKLCFLAFIHSCLVRPYSNRKRHNSPNIPQTPYQTLIIPCPNFDPIYQVILQENSNEWNLSPAKKDPRKMRSKDWKANEVKPHLKSSVFQKKEEERIRFTSCWERFYQKKEWKEITFPIVQNLMCGLIHIHTSFAFALPSIPWLFPFLNPFHYTILRQPWLFATQTL
jgi:hypothetical protein